jgi:uncharacterized Ntn-hydrolase superfamily protein
MTYSIVARDPETGQMGVAVQTRYLGAGAVVPWAEAGVGVVATQGFTEVSYGPQGLARMREGVEPGEAIEALVREDSNEAVRQVAMVDARGRVAVHTGSRCVREFGSVHAEGVGAQANMVERDTVWEAMLEAFLGASGDLADRLISSLRAAEAEGGDVRGRQSAALVVVSGSREGGPWARMVDLRVDDHTDPVGELARLLSLYRAFDHLARSGEYAAAFRLPEALAELDLAATDAPGEDQIAFWRALALAGNGRIEEARSEMARIRGAEPRWTDYLRRVAEAGLFPNDPAVLDAIAPLASEQGEALAPPSE